MPEAKVRAAIEHAARVPCSEYGKVVYSNSLGAESMVLTDLIWTQVPQIEIFSSIPVACTKKPTSCSSAWSVATSDASASTTRIRRRLKPGSAENGINGFYNGMANRQACCHIRKVEPFRRAIAGCGCLGDRRAAEQSATRAQAEAGGIRRGQWRHRKISPILDWTHDEVWDYIRAHKLPYNPLHDKGYPSIGCAPCTRAVEPGADSRSGRWWWENADSKECGLHPRIRVVDPQPRLRPDRGAERARSACRW